MKALLLALSLIAPFLQAQAEVKRPGTFVPSLCSVPARDGARIDVLAVSSACLGRIVGAQAQVIRLQLNDGSVRSYAVEFEHKRGGGMGIFANRFTGGQLTGEGRAFSEGISGILTTTSGITVTHELQLRTSGNLRFRGALRAVYVTQ